MKKLVLFLSALAVSVGALASEKVSVSDSEAFQMLDYVVGVQRTYSQTSGLEAKVIELLGGDGVNPTRMVLILNTAMGEKAKVYELNEMMVKVTRVTFLAKDVIVINYSQDSFEGQDADKLIQIKKSLKVTVQRDAKGNLTNEIITEDISK